MCTRARILGYKDIWAALQATKHWVSEMLTLWQLRVKEIKPEVYDPEIFIQV